MNPLRFHGKLMSCWQVVENQSIHKNLWLIVNEMFMKPRPILRIGHKDYFWTFGWYEITQIVIFIISIAKLFFLLNQKIESCKAPLCNAKMPWYSSYYLITFHGRLQRLIIIETSRDDTSNSKKVKRINGETFLIFQLCNEFLIPLRNSEGA